MSGPTFLRLTFLVRGTNSSTLEWKRAAPISPLLIVRCWRICSGGRITGSDFARCSRLLPLGALPGRRQARRHPDVDVRFGVWGSEFRVSGFGSRVVVFQARRHPDVDVRSDFFKVQIPRLWYKFDKFGVETSCNHPPSCDCSMLANVCWWSHYRFRFRSVLPPAASRRSTEHPAVDARSDYLELRV